MPLVWLGKIVTIIPAKGVKNMAKAAHIIVDGYNLIRQIPQLTQAESHSLEAGRKKLIQLLGRYHKLKSHRITVVFDGASGLGEFAPVYREAGVGICFSPAGQSADDVIHRLCRETKSGLIVVSSDRGVTDFATNCGHVCLDSVAFFKKITLATENNSLVDQLKSGKTRPHKRWSTKKRGPSKRLPKSERRKRTKLKIL